MSDQSYQGEPLPPISSAPGLLGSLQERGFLTAPNCPGALAGLESYDVLSVVGVGGMGIILKAFDLKTRNLVAIKLLRPELAVHRHQVHRFLKEARHMQRLQHPNIMTVLNVCEAENRPYFVMPFLERGSLLQELSEETPFEVKRSIGVARQVASALVHAHSRGVIHRDLKPGNVLLDFDGNAIVSDFGLARTLFNDSAIDVAAGQQNGEGTVHYMSPQVARGEAEDTRCDIYALGALLYEMLTGCPPYQGNSSSEIIEKIKRSAPKSLLELRPSISSGISDVVQAAMGREHRERYANMADLEADLERIQNNLPPLHLPKPHRPRRGAQRTQRNAAVAACAFLVFAAGVTGFDRFRTEYVIEQRLAKDALEGKGWIGAQMGDWDGDGQIEAVQVLGNKLYADSFNGQTFLPRVLEGVPDQADTQLSLLHDINSDGVDDAFVSWSSNKAVRIEVFNQNGWPLKKFTFDGSVHVHSQYGTNLTSLRPLRVADINKDGRRELLASVQSTWGLRPRGLACFDIDSEELKWFVETADFVTAAELFDINEDGGLEILLGSCSPGNYRAGRTLPDGTDDTQAYVYIVSSEGELVLRKNVGGMFTSATPLAPRKGTSMPAFWVTKDHAWSVEHEEPDTGKLLRFDPAGTLKQELDFQVQLTGVKMADLEMDGREEVLVADRTGRLTVLNSEWQPRSSTQIVSNQFGEVILTIVDELPTKKANSTRILLSCSQIERGGPQFPGNNREEIPKDFMRNVELRVLDGNLRNLAGFTLAQKWNYSFPFAGMFNVPKSRGPLEIDLITDRVQVLSLTTKQRAWFGRAKQTEDDGI